MTLPTDAKERKDCPIATGVIDYFPDALAEVARVSKAGNDQHNPGQPLHWNRAKSTDESDALMRHFLERGKMDSDGQRHSAKVAWRALAMLQKEIEAKTINTAIKRGAERVDTLVDTSIPSADVQLLTNPRSLCLATCNAGSGAAYTCNKNHGHLGRHAMLNGLNQVVKEW